MSFLEIVLLAVGLSMDSLAVSVTGGALIQNYRHHHMLKIGCVMGIFQAGMTIAGYLAGMSFKKYITAFDHWIAFLLLLYLGGKMIYESTQEKEEDCRTNPLCYKTLCGLGIATSIDALAVGISLACIESAIALEALTIGIVTFLFSAFGVYFGNHFSRKIDLKLDLIDPDRHRHQNPDRASLFQWISHHFTFTSSQTTISQLFPVNPVNAPQGSSPLYKSKPAPPPSCLSIKTP